MKRLITLFIVLICISHSAVCMATTKTVRFIGDSITYGWWANGYLAETNYGLVERFRDSVATQFPTVQWTVYNNGHPGWTTDSFLVGGDSFNTGPGTWSAEALNSPADITVIMLGFNDAAVDEVTNTIRVTPATYESNLRSMVADIKALGKVVVLMTEPATSDYPDVGALYIPRMRTVAADLGVPLIDSYAAFVGKGDQIWNYYEDLVHPNAAGHQLICDTILSEWSGITGVVRVLPAAPPHHLAKGGTLHLTKGGNLKLK